MFEQFFATSEPSVYQCSYFHLGFYHKAAIGSIDILNEYKQRPFAGNVEFAYHRSSKPERSLVLYLNL